MSDQPEPKRSLSEISHLFLSGIRDRQTQGAPRPVRKPPPKAAVSIDLSPEEFAQVFGNGEPEPRNPNARIAPITALIGAHLNGKQFDYAKRYARHLAMRIGRIGLIELDASEFRLMCFDRSDESMPVAHGEAMPVESYDPRQMVEAMEEMNCDVRAWLLLLPSPRVPEARRLLRDVERWVMLSTCDHDGVVSCYRNLKGLADLHRPSLSLALLDATSEDDAARVARKLTGVCQQFLGWHVDDQTVVHDTDRVSEHLVMCCRPTRDKAQLASAPQWDIVSDFLTRAKSQPMEEEKLSHAPTMEVDHAESTAAAERDLKQMVAEVVVTPAEASAAVSGGTSGAPVEAAPMAFSAASSSGAPMPPVDAADNEVIDLVAGDSADAILASVLHAAPRDLIECPIRPPMCPGARLAVTRERGLALLAVTGKGLTDLRAIGQSYRWLIENRPLIAMAMPQFAIDAHRLPSLRLFVDHADLTADVLQPMLQTGNVTVQAYRKLRWGGKTGLLLEAA